MQFINEAKQKATEFAEANAAALLTAGGVVGTVATAVLAGRGGYKFAEVLAAKKEDLIHEKLDEFKPGEEPVVPVPQVDTFTKIRIAVPYFLPPVITGGATIASIIMANRVSAQKAAALAAAYGLAERNLSEYREKVAEKLTGPKKTAIDDELAQERMDRADGYQNIVIVEGEVLCFDEATARYFRSTMENIRAAVNAVNAEIINHDYATATFFYDELGMPGTTWTDELGWNRDHLLDLKITTGLSPDKRPCISIDFKTLPKPDYIPKNY